MSNFKRYVKKSETPEIMVGPQFDGDLQPFWGIDWESIGINPAGIVSRTTTLVIYYGSPIPADPLGQAVHTVVVPKGHHLCKQGQRLVALNPKELSEKWEIAGNGAARYRLEDDPCGGVAFEVGKRRKVEPACTIASPGGETLEIKRVDLEEMAGAMGLEVHDCRDKQPGGARS